MERAKASDFPQEVLNIFDLYIHGHIAGEDSWIAPRSMQWAA